MNFTVIFVLAVLFAAIAPAQSAHLWSNILGGIMPILYKLLEGAIVVAGIAIMIGIAKK